MKGPPVKGPPVHPRQTPRQPPPQRRRQQQQQRRRRRRRRPPRRPMAWCAPSPPVPRLRGPLPQAPERMPSPRSCQRGRWRRRRRWRRRQRRRRRSLPLEHRQLPLSLPLEPRQLPLSLPREHRHPWRCQQPGLRAPRWPPQRLRAPRQSRPLPARHAAARGPGGRRGVKRAEM